MSLYGATSAPGSILCRCCFCSWCFTRLTPDEFGVLTDGVEAHIAPSRCADRTSLIEIPERETHNEENLPARACHRAVLPRNRICPDAPTRGGACRTFA